MKFSELHQRLSLDKVGKLKETNDLALLTHVLQSTDVVNEIDEVKYGYSRDDLEKFEDSGIQLRVPIQWDVPFPPPQDPLFTFIDLFAGIGGFRMALQSLNGKCVFSSEWDKFAQKTYLENFGELPFGDIKVFTDPSSKTDSDVKRAIPDHDILCAGFPCQPFSLAGVSKKNSLGRKHGFLDETQGTLFFDIARIIKVKRPRAFILENVKNLRSHDKGKTYRTIRRTLEGLDYEVFDKVLDGRYYVPQHRERIFIVGFDKKKGKVEDFIFPTHDEEQMVVEEILEDQVPEKYTLSDHLWKYLQDYAAKHKAAGNGFGYGIAARDSVTRTLSARYHKDGSEILIDNEDGQNPRRLTPRECARLQGYPETFKIPVSDTQAYRQFGNSVVVPLVKEVAKRVSEKLGL